jgi:hypothetical protein
MSMHDQLTGLVAEAQAEYLTETKTIRGMLQKLKSEWLPAYFGGNPNDFQFFHPVESVEGQKDLLAFVLAEKGRTFAVGLRVHCDIDFAYFLRIANVTKDKADIQVIGTAKACLLPGQAGIKGFCKQLLDTGKAALAEHGVQDSTKAIAVNVYE